LVSGKEAVSDAAGPVPGIQNLADGIPGHLPGSLTTASFYFFTFAIYETIFSVFPCPDIDG